MLELSIRAPQRTRQRGLRFCRCAFRQVVLALFFSQPRLDDLGTIHLVGVHQACQLVRQLPGHRRLLLLGDRDCIRGIIRVHDVAAKRGELAMLLLFLGARQQNGHNRLRVGMVWQKLDICPLVPRQARLHQFRQLLLHERKLDASAEVRLLGEHPYLQPLRHIDVRHHDLGEQKRVLALSILQQGLFQLLRQLLDPASAIDLQ